MSFASEVKKEILNPEQMSLCCKKAMLFGLLQGTAEVILDQQGMKILIKSYMVNAVKFIISTLKEIYPLKLEIAYKEVANVQNRRYYYLEVTEYVTELVALFCLLPTDDITNDHPLLQTDCCMTAFIRGLFVARGSINDPRKNSYHFEIVCRRLDIMELLQEILYSRGIDSSYTPKKENYVLYVKRSEHISNCLALIGANAGVFYFEDSRIYRDVSNMANRMTNCDIANEKKCAASCQKQLQAIAYIDKMGSFEKMPLRLQTMAKMRLEYPEACFDELASFSDNLFGRRMSKSGISHCMKALMKYYGDLLEKTNKKS